MNKFANKNPTKSSKIKYFYISLFFVVSAYTAIDAAMDWKITPSQEEIQYTIGLVGVDNSSGIDTLSILPSATFNDRINFGCGYNLQPDAISNQCLDESLLASIKGNVATVGWYKLKGVFGYKNPYPQMVSIEVDNSYLKSYNETKVLNEGYNNARAFLACITLFVYFLMLQTMLYINKKNLLKQSKSHNI